MKIASVVTDLLIVIGQFGLAAVMFPAGIAARHFGRALINLDQMTRFHDVSNALGFGLGGLLGWEQSSRRRKVRQ